MNVPQFTSTKKGVLSDIAEIIMGQSPNGESYNKDGNGVPLINGPTEFGPISPKIIQWTDKPTKYAHDKDLLLCVRGSSIGRMNISNDTYCIGRGVAAIRPINKNINADYLRFLVQRNVHKILKKSAGSTFPNLSSSDLKSFPISIPNLEIQQLIGDFLSNISKKIQLQQQKIDLLQEQKKGFLQKMFPKAGETKPEIRFDGFTGDWEERKLNEFTTYGSSSYSLSQFLKDDFQGVYPVFDANNEIARINTYAQENDYISIIKDGAGIGRTELRPAKSSVIGTMGYINPNNSDINFIYALMKNINWSKYQNGSTIPHVYYRDYGNEYFSIPRYEEQQQIGLFFKKLDDTIGLHQRKLDIYKEQKKGFMQQMFI